MGISAAELAQMREAINDLLPDTCNILSGTASPDGFGGMTTTWGTASAAVACRMDHKTGREQLTGGAVQTYQGNMLTVPYDTTITTANRVEYNSATYAVVAVSEGSWIACKRVTVERL